MKVNARDLIGFLCGVLGLIAAGMFAYTLLIQNSPSLLLAVATAMCGSSMIILKLY